VAGRIAAQQAEYLGLPTFNALESAARLCDFLETRVPDYLECEDPTLPNPELLTLELNKKNVRMVPFVQKILRNAVLGVVRELEGYQDGAEIIITLKGGNTPRTN
jgi:molybdopterin-guanine dinucleotide biosynthesis protein B